MAKQSMFEGAAFGTMYKTRDGLRAIYVGDHKGRHIMWIEGNLSATLVDDNGYYSGIVSMFDIVGLWEGIK